MEQEPLKDQPKPEDPSRQKLNLELSKLFWQAGEAYGKNFLFYFVTSALVSVISVGVYLAITVYQETNLFLTSFSMVVSDQFRALLMHSLVFLSVFQQPKKNLAAFGSIWRSFFQLYIGRILVLSLPFLFLHTLTYKLNLPLFDFFTLFFLFAPFYNLYPTFTPFTALKDSTKQVLIHFWRVVLFQFCLFLINLVLFGLILYSIYLGFPEKLQPLVQAVENAKTLEEVYEFFAQPFFLSLYVGFYTLVQPFQSIALVMLFLKLQLAGQQPLKEEL